MNPAVAVAVYSVVAVALAVLAWRVVNRRSVGLEANAAAVTYGALATVHAAQGWAIAAAVDVAVAAILLLVGQVPQLLTRREIDRLNSQIVAMRQSLQDAD